MNKFLSVFSTLFPLWVIVAGGISFFQPEIFTWFNEVWITWGLGIIMLGMGLHLKLQDFKRVVTIPWQVFLGVFFHYTIMPALGYSGAKIFALSNSLAVGFILVSCCPCGTASNVINFLAKSDLPLAVTITAISTMIAVVMTPVLTELLVGNRMEVSAAKLFLSTARVILIPVLLGLLLNQFLPRVTVHVLPFAPPVAVVMIVMIVASIVGQNKNEIVNAGFTLLAAVFFLHGFGFLLGYVFARLFLNELSARTISVEVGMQNSGLAVVLAKVNFSADPLVAVPGAISSLVHSVIGSAAAAWWSRRPVNVAKAD